MSIFEYDEEKHMRMVRSEGFEDGLEQGIEQGIGQGIEQVICRMLREDFPVEMISKCSGCSVEHINQIRNKMLVES